MAEHNFVLSETARFLRGRAWQDLDKMFLRALGCPFCVRQGEVEWPKVPQRSYADVQAALPQILSSLGPDPSAPWDRPSLLAGLYVNNCWRTCLDTEAGTYDLAAALLTYLEQNRTEGALDVATAPVVLAILNDWLAPMGPWKDLPSLGVVLEAMFGRSWCYLALPEGVDFHRTTSPHYRIGEMVHRDRPMFLPGLLPEHAELKRFALPDLDGPT